MKKLSYFLVSSVLGLTSFGAMFSGCASLVQGEHQQLQVNTYNDETEESVPADCTLTNDEGTVRSKSNRSVQVARDKDLLTVECKSKDNNLTGTTQVNGEINIGYWAADFFLIDLCIVSCWVDGMTGSWVEYPAIIDVPLTTAAQ